MNLFWETRRLTEAREDHLTCFLAAALEADSAFRAAYEQRVLAPLAIDTRIPTIMELETQAQFRSESCRPDLLLRLSDGRTIICEHKLDASETPLVLEGGEVKLQLSRYLALNVDGVAYFRSSLVSMSNEILSHPKYVRPPSAAHFLWRDLYPALECGLNPVTIWLREGFEKLGFTPPLAHVGDLWPDDSNAVRENQANFAKLWHTTRSLAEQNWVVNIGRRCELYLKPREPGRVTQVYISPLAENGTLLRIRAHSDPQWIEGLGDLLETASSRLPTPECDVRGHSDYSDILIPLRHILRSSKVGEQESALAAHVLPVLEALTSASGPLEGVAKLRNARPP